MAVIIDDPWDPAESPESARKRAREWYDRVIAPLIPPGTGKVVVISRAAGEVVVQEKEK